MSEDGTIGEEKVFENLKKSYRRLKKLPKIAAEDWFSAPKDFYEFMTSYVFEQRANSDQMT